MTTNDQICGIMEDIRAKDGEPGETEIQMLVRVMMDRLTKLSRGRSRTELYASIRSIRSLLLDILFRLTMPERVEENKVAIAADKFWDQTLRDAFVEEVKNLLADPEVKAIFENTRNGEEPLHDFIDELVVSQLVVSKDLARFAWMFFAGR